MNNPFGDFFANNGTNKQKEIAKRNNQEKQKKEKAQEKANFNNHKKQSGGTKSEGGIVGKATASYNFIPLNHKNEFAKFKKPDDFDNFNGISGEINLTITTKTPFFIGDEQKQGEVKKFFSIDGVTPKIPGSSLRGMIRNLVEIVSYGKFENTNLTTFYYRNMAGKGESTLKAEYARIMSSKDKDGVPRPNAKFGYFVKEGERKYAIYKATKEQAKRCSVYKDYDLKGLDELMNHPNALEICQKIANENMTIKPVGDKYIVHTGVTTKTIGDKKNIKSAKKTYFKFKKLSKDELKALDKISLDYELIELYEADNKRQPQRDKKFLNLVKLANDYEKYPNGVPCFFVEHERAGIKYVFFGHTPYFRIPYFKSVKEHIPEYEFGENYFDLTECIFGKESKFASRVFFEDANLVSDLKDIFQKETRTQNLQGPKPTSYNMYLENSLKSKVSSVKHYNDDVMLRGYKMYHHKDTKNEKDYKFIPDQQRPDNEKMKNVIRAIKSGVNFKGKIRFSNLKDYELGALMFVLNLPKNCFHKLGGAKPLGLGSVEINAKLSVYDITKSYENLFSDNGICELSLINEQKDYIKAFESKILEQIGSNNNSLWEEPRLKELEIMLNYEKSKNIDSRYMDINDFKHKDKVLPRPSELIKKQG
ncbi:TIGR03986 family CRISPR-associated RAMP protein [Campylobacter sp. MG1]|uniref:TIGR03986 family type III CRISPR-associated RAMP protein n=1 Tax=Campylobacter sp. MG1 TaxID=2976332 RepID=UPI00226D352D|nr:TIGR03986 family CRISPR-associated RAMP protein [Campylobacter sp. MG1]